MKPFEVALLLVLILALLMIPVAYMLGSREGIRSKKLPWFGQARSAIPSIVNTNSIVYAPLGEKIANSMGT